MEGEALPVGAGLAGPPSSMHSGIRVASSVIFSLMLSLRLLSTALWLSRLLLRFSFAIRACLSCGERAAADCKAVVVVGGCGGGSGGAEAVVGEVGELGGGTAELRPTVTEKLVGIGPPGLMAKADERARGFEFMGRLEERAPATEP